MKVGVINMLDDVEEAINNLGIGLSKYTIIMDLLYKVDVSIDSDFQRLYNGFYRLRQREPEFYSEYYKYLEGNKNGDIRFDDALLYFYKKFQRIEASFSSKLVATLNPHLPVWDSIVMKNLGLKRPAQSSANRIDETIDIYNKICRWYEDFLETDKAKEMILFFNEKYPATSLTDVKKN